MTRRGDDEAMPPLESGNHRGGPHVREIHGGGNQGCCLNRFRSRIVNPSGKLFCLQPLAPWGGAVVRRCGAPVHPLEPQNGSNKNGSMKFIFFPCPSRQAFEAPSSPNTEKSRAPEERVKRVSRRTWLFHNDSALTEPYCLKPASSNPPYSSNYPIPQPTLFI
jgi:hypothetical protein